MKRQIETLTIFFEDGMVIARFSTFKLVKHCDWCGAREFRVNLDGDDLCQGCANKWVHGEGQAAMEREDERR